MYVDHPPFLPKYNNNSSIDNRSAVGISGVYIYIYIYIYIDIDIYIYMDRNIRCARVCCISNVRGWAWGYEYPGCAGRDNDMNTWRLPFFYYLFLTVLRCPSLCNTSFFPILSPPPPHTHIGVFFSSGVLRMSSNTPIFSLLYRMP